MTLSASSADACYSTFSEHETRMQESMWRSLGRHLQACHRAEWENCTHAADNGVPRGVATVVATHLMSLDGRQAILLPDRSVG